MNDNILVVIPTNKEKVFSENTFKFLGIPYKIIKNNTRGLSEIYNEAIEEALKNNIEYLVLMHDDLLITDIYFQAKLNKVFNLGIDVVGLVGSQEFNPYKSEKIAWHLCSDKQKFVGALEHFHDTYFTYNYYGPVPASVKVLDGVFFAINLKKIGNVRFDEVFKFNFYDLSFCLNCNKNNIKLGVTNIHGTHLSSGAGLNTSQYLIDQELFKKKYLIS